jgi:hypothetical protein
MFIDASEKSSLGVVTQIHAEDANKSVQLQRHEPLGFVGHRFNETKLNWSVTGKEGFAIKDVMQKTGLFFTDEEAFQTVL